MNKGRRSADLTKEIKQDIERHASRWAKGLSMLSTLNRIRRSPQTFTTSDSPQKQSIGLVSIHLFLRLLQRSDIHKVQVIEV